MDLALTVALERHRIRRLTDRHVGQLFHEIVGENADGAREAALAPEPALVVQVLLGYEHKLADEQTQLVRLCGHIVEQHPGPDPRPPTHRCLFELFVSANKNTNENVLERNKQMQMPV